MPAASEEGGETYLRSASTAGLSCSAAMGPEQAHQRGREAEPSTYLISAPAAGLSAAAIRATRRRQLGGRGRLRASAAVARQLAIWPAKRPGTMV